MSKFISSFNLGIPALLAVFVFLLPGYVFASQAGIVIKKQDGTVKSSCVIFDQSSISGMDLLQKSGFNLIVKDGFVVSIDGEGSKDSSQMSGDDLFWSYWELNNNWSFQNTGANYSRVKDGEVEGWEFGGGSCSLPKIAFGQICYQAKQNKSYVPADGVEQEQVAVKETAEEDELLLSEQVQASKTSTSGVVTSEEPILTPTANFIQKEVRPDAAVKGSSDQVFPDVFPEFNIINILILFLVFIACAIVFVFIKMSLRNFVNSRRKK